MAMDMMEREEMDRKASQATDTEVLDTKAACRKELDRPMTGMERKVLDWANYLMGMKASD